MAKQTSTKTRSSVPPKPGQSAAPKSREPIIAKPASSHDQIAAKAAPSYDQIAARAFELYKLRAPWAGSALGDWLQAERELAP